MIIAYCLGFCSGNLYYVLLIWTIAGWSNTGLCLPVFHMRHRASRGQKGNPNDALQGVITHSGANLPIIDDAFK
jgi:hypothetical protein